MAKKRSIPQPATTVESQAIERYFMNKNSMDPRQFREGLTKVTGGVRGVPTEAAQWKRWDR